MTEAEELELLELEEQEARSRKPAPSGPSALKSGIGGALQGVTLGFGDELGGALMRLGLGDGVQLGKGAEVSPDDSPEMRALKQSEAAKRKALPTTYEIGRDLVRGGLKDAREANPKTFLAGEVLGGSLVPVPGGAAAAGATRGAKVLRALAQGAGTGAVYGLGNSEASLGRGEYGDLATDTALGAGIGGVGGALAEGVVAPILEAGGRVVGKGLDAVRKRAGQGVRDAAARAEAMALKEGKDEVAALTGSLGAETQKGSRMTENIRRIPGEAAQATPESQAALMRDAAKLARQRAEDMLNQAKAQGLEDVPDRVGEFLTKGSKLDKAQKGRSQAQRLLEGAKQMEDDAEKVLRGELAPKALDANLQRVRDMAMDSANFKQLEGTVLSENLRNLPKQVAEIEAIRSARDAAEKGLGGNASKRAAEILSGKAATQRLKEQALRYALPGAGALAGEVLGDDYGPLGTAAGMAAGWKLGGSANARIGALAGAGLRPGLQALYRTATQYPAVSRLLWNGVGGVADAGIERLPSAIASKLLPPASRSEEAMTSLSAPLRRLLERRAEKEKSERKGLAER